MTITICVVLSRAVTTLHLCRYFALGEEGTYIPFPHIYSTVTTSPFLTPIPAPLFLAYALLDLHYTYLHLTPSIRLHLHTHYPGRRGLFSICCDTDDAE